MNIGERIKQRRLELKLSADEVAIRLGKNRATIYRYENNDIENLPTTVLEPLAKILETTPAYLMGWSNSKEGGEQYKVYAEIPASNVNEAIHIAIKAMLSLNGYEDRANSITEDEALKLYKASRFDDVLALDNTDVNPFCEIKKYFEMLNDKGKHEATKRVMELTEVPRYAKENTKN